MQQLLPNFIEFFGKNFHPNISNIKVSKILKLYSSSKI